MKKKGEIRYQVHHGMTEEALSRATSRDDNPSRHPGVVLARDLDLEPRTREREDAEFEMKLRFERNPIQDY